MYENKSENKKDEFLDPLLHFMVYYALLDTSQEESCCTILIFYFHIFFSNKDNILNSSFDHFLNSQTFVRYSHVYKCSHTSTCIYMYILHIYKCRYKYFLYSPFKIFHHYYQLLIQTKIQNKILMVFLFVLNNCSSFIY